MQAIEDKVISRIYGKGRGWAFSKSDFFDLGTGDAVDQALSRLTKAQRIRRVMRGLYDYPQYSDLLQKTLSPDFDQVAQALARKFNWRIQASGNAALNLLGLSTQVPAKMVYLSDGPNRSYPIGLTALTFKQSALKNIGFKHRESGLIVHALKALGQDRVDDAVIVKIRSQLDAKQYKLIMQDTATVTAWVYEVIRTICLDDR
jgi:hypothetical protein